MLAPIQELTGGSTLMGLYMKEGTIEMAMDQEEEEEEEEEEGMVDVEVEATMEEGATTRKAQETLGRTNISLHSINLNLKGNRIVVMNSNITRHPNRTSLYQTQKSHTSWIQNAI